MKFTEHKVDTRNHMYVDIASFGITWLLREYVTGKKVMTKTTAIVPAHATGKDRLITK